MPYWNILNRIPIANILLAEGLMHRKKQASALVATISADNLSLYNCYIEVRLKKSFQNMVCLYLQTTAARERYRGKSRRFCKCTAFESSLTSS